jgi:hypothetical protein
MIRLPAGWRSHLSWASLSLLLLAVALPAKGTEIRPAATVAEILGYPVTIFRTDQQQILASLGAELQVGDQVRTSGQARAQIQSSQGLYFRIGGNAVLTVQPDLELDLHRGQMITWIDRVFAQPVRIRTPIAVAAMQGTTVFVDLPAHQKWARFFSWEGTVRISLPESDESIELQAGEAVIIPMASHHIPPAYPVDKATLQDRFEENHLLHGFRSEMSTLPEIKKVVD